MTKYYERLIKIGNFTLYGILSVRGKVQLCLSLQSDLEGIILDFKNIYYLPRSFSNLVSLGLLNDHDIYYHNKRETLYDWSIKTILVYIEHWRNSFLLRPLNLSNITI